MDERHRVGRFDLLLLKRIGASLFVILLLYHAVGGILHSCGIHIGMPSVPYLRSLFEMYVVFDRYSDTAYGFSARGVPTDARPGSVELIEIDLDRLFPQARGDAYRRLEMWGRTEEQRTRLYQHLAQQVQALHNLRNPGRRVNKVYIYRHTWPKSTRGYKDRYEERRSLIVGHN